VNKPADLIIQKDERQCVSLHEIELLLPGDQLYLDISGIFYTVKDMTLATKPFAPVTYDSEGGIITSNLFLNYDRDNWRVLQVKTPGHVSAKTSQS